MPTVSIVILTFNNVDYTRQCLESIWTKEAGADFEVIVVDNASSDGTPDYLREFAAAHDHCRLILNTENTGFARGNNLGAAQAAGEYIVFLNNDTVVTRGWLAGLVRHLQDPALGMVGPVTNSSGNETRIRVGYGRLDEMELFAGSYTSAHAGESFEVAMLAFLCVALRRQVWEETGPLDERFGLGMFEDDDYALRLKKKGYKILCAEDVFIHHWGSASFSKLDQAQRQALFEENRAQFEAKWGFTWQLHCYRPALLHEPIHHTSDPFPVSDSAKLLARLQEAVTERDDQLYRMTSKLNETEQALQQKTIYVENLQRSRAWKLLQFLQNLRRSVFPPK
jgi:GT2 family glycosyltransferase